MDDFRESERAGRGREREREELVALRSALGQAEEGERGAGNHEGNGKSS